ncbi:hypothetical protein HELRODRAFT_183077 [Helobdella robusta]|uniref:Fibrinogen C-terminal domain-containing protein n=1 Tax=Helobdella robusta TaxID=6412 RepID=T1FJ49_HELRO|nr:hypothetical protein HELRODRAFT_183077 [Helobdella robusta]ESN89872.1 hypothetical protein HELRODRAFT_183077 [Helobdella robusta]
MGTVTVPVTLPNIQGTTNLINIDTWTLIQQHTNPYHMNYPWLNYRNGFGSPPSFYWLGLEAVYQLVSARPHMLKLEVLLNNGLFLMDQYSTFSLKNETEKYAIHVSGWMGSNADVFNYSPKLGMCHNNQKFSTYDNYNSGGSTNCYNTYGGGWWYYATYCQSSNLNAYNSYFVYYSKVNDSSVQVKISKMYIKATI